MTIENLPPFYDMKFTIRDGNLTREANMYMDQTFQTLENVVDLLNTFVTVDGITIPNKTTAEITALEPNASLGTMWFNTTLAKLQVKTAAGTIETITSV